MPNPQIGIRLNISGAADFEREVSDTAKRAGAAGARALSSSLGEIDTSTLDKLREREAALAKAQDAALGRGHAQAAFNAALGVSSAPAKSARESAAAFEAATKAQGDMAAQAAALRARIDPLSASQTAFGKATQQADALLKAGTITEAEHAAALKLAQNELAASATAAGSFAATSGLASARVTALTAAIRHMIDASIAGRPVVQSLAMEAGNLSYGLGGGVGLGAAFKSVASGVAGFVTPVSVGITAAAAAAAGLLAVTASVEKGEKELDAAVSGVGRGAGVTAAVLEEMARAQGKLGALTIGQARGIEAALAHTGDVQGAMIAKVTANAAGYIRTTGETSQQAASDLAKAFSDPAKGADVLAAKLGGLTNAERMHIDSLQAQGRTSEAQSALNDYLSRSLEATGNSLSRFDQGVHALSTAWGEASNAIGHYIAQHNVLAGLLNKPMPSLNQQQRATDAARAAQRGNATAPLIAAALPDIGALRDYDDRAKNLNGLLTDPAALAAAGYTYKQASDALSAYAHAYATFVDPAERAAKAEQLNIEALTAKTPAAKAAIAAQRERLALDGEAISTAEAEARITAAQNQAYGEAAEAIAEENRQLVLNRDANLALAAAQRQGAGPVLESQALSQARAAALQSGVDPAARARLLLGVSISGEIDQAAEQIASLERQTAAQKALDDEIAKGAITREQARAQLQAMTQIQDLQSIRSVAAAHGFTVEAAALDDLIARLKSAGAASEDEARRQQAAEAAQERQIAALGDVKSRLADFFTSAIGGKPNFRGLASGLLEDTERGVGTSLANQLVGAFSPAYGAHVGLAGASADAAFGRTGIGAEITAALDSGGKGVGGAIEAAMHSGANILEEVLGGLFKGGRSLLGDLFHFAGGTASSPGGYAVVGEQGRELIRAPDGHYALSAAQASLVYLPAGSEVLSAARTRAMFAPLPVPAYAQGTPFSPASLPSTVRGAMAAPATQQVNIDLRGAWVTEKAMVKIQQMIAEARAGATSDAVRIASGATAGWNARAALWKGP